ncbi:signal recognition particle-docking protein FtsY [Leucothrix arctica]|uniref:Signal recognition particle receptor FtsY n=1 Tax=Leucothrix arctica TaxID=1481894 RepID=A0A317C8Y7_9GAMM|nr:signal recognition particle-docking protein FtsY [Leucothrix arctica]PWQ94777.1 signal recognition particle-docking protein FtsY [Leucothrix arctica]
MFNFFKKKKQPEQGNETQTDVIEAPEATVEVSEPEAPIAVVETTEDTPKSVITDALETAERPGTTDKKGLFSRLKNGLAKTGSSLTEGMGNLFLGSKKIDEDVLEELETRLLMADVGVEATTKIIDTITQQVARNELADTEALMQVLYKSMTEILEPVAKPLVFDESRKLNVILMVGINGAGKTTTIGKLAKKFQNEGKTVMLAAGDTFRAAAVEQLQTWGERNNVAVIAQGQGSDTASVIYDGMEAAKARGVDILLADTAGRLHTQTNLMEELKKVKRVMQKIDPTAPHEIMLVVDASIGQNALAQAKEFNAALGLTGITVTKLDGTAKGGILFAIANQTGIPVRFVGVGESIDDLQTFDAETFVGALLGGEKS